MSETVRFLLHESIVCGKTAGEEFLLQAAADIIKGNNCACQGAIPSGISLRLRSTADETVRAPGLRI
jgi:hypothetical protein